jgi:hypothetical protein
MEVGSPSTCLGRCDRNRGGTPDLNTITRSRTSRRLAISDSTMTCRRQGGLGGDGDGEGWRGLWEAAVGGVAAPWVGSDRAFEREQLRQAEMGNEG